MCFLFLPWSNAWISHNISISTWSEGKVHSMPPSARNWPNGAGSRGKPVSTLKPAKLFASIPVIHYGFFLCIAGRLRTAKTFQNLKVYTQKDICWGQSATIPEVILWRTGVEQKVSSVLFIWWLGLLFRSVPALSARSFHSGQFSCRYSWTPSSPKCFKPKQTQGSMADHDEFQYIQYLCTRILWCNCNLYWWAPKLHG